MIRWAIDRWKWWRLHRGYAKLYGGRNLGEGLIEKTPDQLRSEADLWDRFGDHRFAANLREIADDADCGWA